ncbi:hypothetical protein L2D08_23095 [Domibacillus sp. PGB-M46]|uniref:hypothetical protein n=1 Tax=Domibacillus sp. PGB-M46 TaxID=2910255 RepID=UPI001F589232|nr:hypothetical protein [Domibacillus sp. PGB-M46]MCI2257202.1 hypothetical protein [Domibacillus sp. PGB-M46]
MSLLPEFQTITGLIDNGHLLHDEISAMPRTSQRRMYGLMKEIMKDELIFVIEVEKRKLRMNRE